MSNRSFALPLVVLALSAFGCAKPPTTGNASDGELAWARAALERNPQLEVVATDTNARTFTVKQRSSGQVSVVSIDKLAAAPVADLTTSSGTTATPSATAPEAGAAPATPTEDTSATVAAAPPSEQAPPAETSGASATTTDGYTIQREGGQLRVSGPGVSIVSASPAATRTSQTATSTVSDTPIICEGGQFMHLDRRNIRVNGTAVIARNGCELHITNSTIEASGPAVEVIDATVNIANSTISGGAASLDLNGKARLFTRSSTFRGIIRRNEPAELNDQGGNTWR
jgi:hypothetical protein